MIEKIPHQTDIQILIPVAFGFVLTFLPSLLGILLMTKGTQTDPYLLHRRLNAPRWFIIFLSLACQAPLIIYVLFLLHTEPIKTVLRGLK